LPFLSWPYAYVKIYLDGLKLAVTAGNEHTGASLAYPDCLFDGYF
jgi:hypothetical protein